MKYFNPPQTSAISLLKSIQSRNAKIHDLTPLFPKTMHNKTNTIMKKTSLFLAAVIAVSASISPQAQELSADEQAMIEWVDERADSILKELETHVNINTGTANIEGLNTYRNLLSKDLEQLGFSTTTHSSDSFEVLNCEGSRVEIADHLVATLRTDQPKKRVLLNGHIDTVFSKDDEFQTLEILDSGVLKGPGVADMKGGIVVMLNALRAIKARGLLVDVHATVLFNTDEEIGSLGSRSLIEELAREHDIGLVYESTFNNLMTHSRKGLGQARIKVIGRESHAGGAHEQGVSAVRELAHKVVAVEQLTDYEKNVTVNTGVLRGGEKRNTVPGCADAYIDMRFPDQAAGDQLIKDIKEIGATRSTANPNYPDLPEIEVWAISHRPVKARSDEVDAVIEEAMQLSPLFGEPIQGTRFSGGGTDGSIAQAVGLPTADSLGVDGKGAHSSREESNVDTLIARTKLAAVMLLRQLHSEQ